MNRLTDDRVIEIESGDWCDYDDARSLATEVRERRAEVESLTTQRDADRLKAAAIYAGDRADFKAAEARAEQAEARIDAAREICLHEESFADLAEAVRRALSGEEAP